MANYSYEIDVEDKKAYFKKPEFKAAKEALIKTFEIGKEDDEESDPFLSILKDTFVSGDKEIIEDEEYSYFASKNVQEMINDLFPPVNIEQIADGKVTKFTIDDKDLYIKTPGIKVTKLMDKEMYNENFNTYYFCEKLINMLMFQNRPEYQSDPEYLTNQAYRTSVAIRMITLIKYKTSKLKKKQ